MAGVVYLVGAGPGDPGLITVRGAELLGRADVVVYDRLVSPELLELATTAELVYAGKEPDTPGAFQQLINETLAAAAKAGKMVVRLKGGDPFVFGRGGEEALALAEAGVRFEVVPGVTSAIAAPAYAGVPVTHRGVASGFTVVAGAEDPARPEPSLDWDALAKTPGTLVVLMGWRSLPAIADALVAAGRSPETPVSVTQWGTLPRQRTVDGTLADIAAKSSAAGLAAPVVTVIGEVAGLRPRINWFDRGALFGKRVLVTRSRTQASALRRMLAEHGAEVIELAAIEVHPVDDPAPLDAALATLGNFEWAVFTSTNGVDAVFERLAAHGRDARAFGGAKVAAIGPATAAALASRGITADFVPDVYTAQAVAEAFRPLRIAGACVLLPRADIAPRTLPDGLAGLGALLTEVEAYRTAAPADAADRAKETLASGTMDAVTFTSSSTVTNLVRLLDGDVSLVNACKVVSIGPATSRTARGLGVRVDVEAAEHTVAGVAKAAVELIGHERAAEQESAG